MAVKYISGCMAASEAVRLAKVEVIAAYPITPQTHIVQSLSNDVFNGRLDAEFVAVEGEHSAMTATVGASMAGARAFTASSSQGLAYMQEVLHYAAGLRTPMVIAVANRSMASPVSIFVDHQDSLPQRDTGVMQFYCENCQDILDLTLMAYKIAEDKRVLLPAMVCFDGFYLSHVSEPVDVPNDDDATTFLPRTPMQYPYLDIDAPKSFNVMAFPDHFEEFSRDRFESMLLGADVFDEYAAEFEKLFGRRHSRLESYRMEDAEYALVGLGSMMGTTRTVVDELRSQGKRVGMLSIKSYRPFPVREVKKALENCKAVGVLDRDVAFGIGGIVHLDVSRCMVDKGCTLKNFIVGLAGRDVTPETIHKAFATVMDEACTGKDVFWPDENTELWQTWQEGGA